MNAAREPAEPEHREKWRRLVDQYPQYRDQLAKATEIVLAEPGVIMEAPNDAVAIMIDVCRRFLKTGRLGSISDLLEPFAEEPLEPTLRAIEEQADARRKARHGLQVIEGGVAKVAIELPPLRPRRCLSI